MCVCERYFGRKEIIVLFNDAKEKFYLRLYVVEHMVKDHSDRERGNPLPPLNGSLSPISGWFRTGQLILQPLLHVVEYWLAREIAQ